MNTMTETPNNSELTRQIARLNTEMTAGFKSIEASTKEGFGQTNAHLKELNGKVAENAKFRVQAQTTLAIFKWIFGALGISNIALIIKIFLQ